MYKYIIGITEYSNLGSVNMVVQKKRSVNMISQSYSHFEINIDVDQDKNAEDLAVLLIVNIKSEN